MDLRHYTRQYTETDNLLASANFFGTLFVYFLSFWAAVAYADVWYLFWPSGVVMAFAIVRLYVLQHDVGHNAFFISRRQNEWAGRALSLFTFAPFEVMKQNHNLHHSYVGNLEHRETGEIYTMTLAEWKNASVAQRVCYRIYRNPLFFVPAGAFFVYFLRYRWPKNTLKFGVKSVLIHNAVLMIMVVTVFHILGPIGLWVWFGFSFLAGMIGVLLVYLQHNFEDTYWDRRPDLKPQVAALQGSSCLDFGWFFDFMVANITLHDIHHYNARIPCYRLRQCHYNIPPELGLHRISFPEAVRALWLKLWDEGEKKLIPFPE